MSARGTPAARAGSYERNMTRPRLAAIISAIAASTVAFLVTRRWSLAGTVTGAAVVPVVYTLVSHWSNEGLDRLARWARTRLTTTSQPQVGCQPPGPRASEKAKRTLYVTRGSAHPRRLDVQWLLAAATVLAFAFSIYSFATAGEREKVVVQKQVIEKTVEKTVVVPETEATPGTDPQGTSTTGLPATTETTNPSPSSTSTAPSATTSPPATEPAPPASG